jgi:hypothetical protein
MPEDGLRTAAPDAPSCTSNPVATPHKVFSADDLEVDIKALPGTAAGFTFSPNPSQRCASALHTSSSCSYCVSGLLKSTLNDVESSTSPQRVARCALDMCLIFPVPMLQVVEPCPHGQHCQQTGQWQGSQISSSGQQCWACSCRHVQSGTHPKTGSSLQRPSSCRQPYHWPFHEHGIPTCQHGPRAGESFQVKPCLAANSGHISVSAA